MNGKLNKAINVGVVFLRMKEKRINVANVYRETRNIEQTTINLASIICMCTCVSVLANT